MVTVVADRAVMHVRFEPGQKPVEATLPTTWDELQQRGIVSDKSTLTRPQYSLTPDGWADGLVSRPPDDLQERCGRLAAALKQVVKGRELDGFTGTWHPPPNCLMAGCVMPFRETCSISGFRAADSTYRVNAFELIQIYCSDPTLVTSVIGRSSQMGCARRTPLGVAG